MSSVKKILTSNVVNGGTVVVNYANDMAFPAATGNYVSINKNRYDQSDGEITVVRGDTSATITNNTGNTWLSGHVLDVEFSTPEIKKTIPMTQAAYDALIVKDPSIFYAIVDNS